METLQSSRTKQYPIIRLTLKPLCSRECGIGVKSDKYINGIESLEIDISRNRLKKTTDFQQRHQGYSLVKEK